MKSESNSQFLLLQSTHRMTIQYDKDIGHLFVPNLTARIPNENGGYIIRTNSLGFRSDFEFNRKGDRGLPKVLLFGDSNVAGDGCSNHERFSDLIGKELGAEVYNFGLSGSGTDQQLLMYEKFAQQLNPELIILAITVHNIERIKIAYRESIERSTGRYVLVPKPYFTLENEQLVLHNVPVSKIRPYVDEVDSDAYEAPFSKSNEALSPSLINLYKKSAILKKTIGQVTSKLNLGLQSKLTNLIEFQPHEDYKRDDSLGWLLMKSIIERFITKASTSKILIVPIPTSPFLAEKSKPVYQTLFENFEVNHQDVKVIDLTSPLIDCYKQDPEHIFFRYDSHYSSFGHRQIAKILVDNIRTLQLLPDKIAIDKVEFLRKISKSIYILGFSAFYHNSSACLVKDGQIVAASDEERFSRIKNDRSFPFQAINFCLEQGGIQQNDLSALVYYDNAYLTFERLLQSQIAVGVKGEKNWMESMPSWISYKLHVPQLIRKRLKYEGLILHENHHRSHAASAFFPSPFRKAAILTIDGVGEWATASIAIGRDNNIELVKEMHFPHSLGLLYSAFTQFTGFKVNSGEYKMMGLAPYGEPKYVDLIYKHLIDLKEDGSLELNMEYFAFLYEPSMTNVKFAELFGGPAREPESKITHREMDIACSIQVVTEDVILQMANYVHKLTGENQLCLAGGVALNCVANGRLLREGPFKEIWIQPAAGDSGCALGAALDVYHTYFNRPRVLSSAKNRSMQGGSYLGPEFSDDEIQAFLNTYDYQYHELISDERPEKLAKILAEGKVLGHFSGRMEFGPRSLGARSILADARNRDMQVKLNLKIKYRESFRPFAPTVLKERVSDYFELDRESPYMLLVAPVKKDRRESFSPEKSDDLLPIVKMTRSDIPAITHVDYSARIQTVTKEDHPDYYELIAAFEKLTGYGVIVNTSFNVRGEPIVCTPYDAYRCFMRTEMDALVLGRYLLYKEEQAEWPEEKGHVEKTEDIKETVVNNETSEKIKGIFDNDFLPLASMFNSDSEFDAFRVMKNKSSNWVDSDSKITPEMIFTISKELDTSNPSPRTYADHITKHWNSKSVARNFYEVLVKLLQVGFEGQDSDIELNENVSDSIYVMY